MKPRFSSAICRETGPTSVADCLDILTQLDRAGQDDAGVMTKVMRLLGLKEAAPA